MVTLAKSTYAVTEWSGVTFAGAVTASDTATVTIKVERATGSVTKVDYSDQYLNGRRPLKITVPKITCDLYYS